MSALELSVDGASTAITLPAHLDVALAHDLQKAMLEHLNADHTVRINASAVERMSIAAVQVLLAAALHAKTAGAMLIFAQPSANMIEQFSDLGLFEQFMSWELQS